MHTAKRKPHGKGFLCRAHAHSKGCPAVHSCHLVNSLPCGVRLKRTAKPTLYHAAWRRSARQRPPHGKLSRRTAKEGSRQRVPSARQSRVARQRPLPCHLPAAHGKAVFAGRVVAVQSLPCKPARQRRCRADFDLCRAFRLHGKALLCRSASYIHAKVFVVSAGHK
jgi:hypothetical protein